MRPMERTIVPETAAVVKPYLNTDAKAPDTVGRPYDVFIQLTTLDTSQMPPFITNTTV